MMTVDVFHSKDDSAWCVRVRSIGQNRVVSRHRTKKAAIRRAKKEAKALGARIDVYKKDGTLQRTLNYGWQL
ncbi:hypothetical protein AKJ58_01000 [candidate division MSBL1 archaeon SCGC-AAA385D11]|uniref:DUF2188 domain-containing protein n=1 Tax=candidate division MSBL1 archaeon SCGC-AAA385D11 TaxID=1698286 RepID=A0A133VNS5_9EURY|nr:hypothetical protein AKJ58_01000 [candidate division MSBL1 archaeon SCGC-AAA385D11]